ncbi:hypothetical protein B0H19DRAFT_1086140 [Mycena capillaripes]|nr:hypothetical protein B0H19DRAFT_1086140 [Mycena capillaripes]
MVDAEDKMCAIGPDASGRIRARTALEWVENVVSDSRGRQQFVRIKVAVENAYRVNGDLTVCGVEVAAGRVDVNAVEERRNDDGSGKGDDDASRSRVQHLGRDEDEESPGRSQTRCTRSVAACGTMSSIRTYFVDSSLSSSTAAPLFEKNGLASMVLPRGRPEIEARRMRFEVLACPFESRIRSIESYDARDKHRRQQTILKTETPVDSHRLTLPLVSPNFDTEWAPVADEYKLEGVRRTSSYSKNHSGRTGRPAD